MIRVAFILMLLLSAFAMPVRAQVFVQPGGGVIVPLPPPPPKIEIPPIPQLGDTLQPNLKPLSRNSFGDRAVRCLDQGAAAGLGPGARGTYSSICANQ